MVNADDAAVSRLLRNVMKGSQPREKWTRARQCSCTCDARLRLPATQGEQKVQVSGVCRFWSWQYLNLDTEHKAPTKLISIRTFRTINNLKRHPPDLHLQEAYSIPYAKNTCSVPEYTGTVLQYQNLTTGDAVPPTSFVLSHKVNNWYIFRPFPYTLANNNIALYHFITSVSPFSCSYSIGVVQDDTYVSLFRLQSNISGAYPQA